MRQEFPIDLPRLGQRSYVQGGTIFNGMLEACDRAFGATWLTPTTVMGMKLEREATSNGRFVIADEAIADLAPNTTFTAKGGAHPIFGYFVEAGRETAREPYDEEQYNRPVEIRADLSGEFVLPSARQRVDFIKGVVGANKLVHQKTDRFGGELQKIQFLYFKGLEGSCVLEVAEALRLSINNLFVEERGAEIWTINRVVVATADLRSEFRLCYRALKPQA